jgi:hypothetical protein
VVLQNPGGWNKSSAECVYVPERIATLVDAASDLTFDEKAFEVNADQSGANV